jgi:tetratricopeptide (TPR) repeat protein
MDLHRELGARYGEAHTWDSLGYVDHRRGHFPEAVASYRDALGLFRELGDRLSEATVLGHLGDTQRAAGDPGAAGAAWRQAAAILDDLRHPDAAKVQAKLEAVAARALARR